MLLQEPGHSPYDLRFQLLGFPVRIAWTFWLADVVFGYGLVQSLDQVLGAASLGVMPLLLLWTVCLFVSILIHELGHALAFRQNGIQASIVLYHFGGLAIPTSSFSPDGGFVRLAPQQNIWISLAGPLAQIGSAAVVVAAVKAAGYRLTVFRWMPGPFYKIPGLLEGAEIDSAGLFALVTFYIFPSVLWAILNLVPVWPLDGGHIMRVGHSVARWQHESSIVGQRDRCGIDGGVWLFKRPTVHGFLVFGAWSDKFSSASTRWWVTLLNHNS